MQPSDEPGTKSGNDRLFVWAETPLIVCPQTSPSGVLQNSPKWNPQYCFAKFPENETPTPPKWNP